MDYDRESQRTGSGNPPADEFATGSRTGDAGLGSATPGTPGISGTTGTPGLGGTAAGTGTTGDPGTRAGSYDRKFNDQNEGIRDRVEEKIEEGRERVNEAIDTGRERAGEAFESGKNRVAGQLEQFGDRLEERARDMEDAGGVQRRAGRVARRASEALDSSADYLRTHDPADMRDDVERAIRERPLLSVGMAVGAGFLLARLLRD
jgi:ElaB/YqjD/DUF883 family membrane-anchored ribosome-binding protein